MIIIGQLIKKNTIRLVMILLWIQMVGCQVAFNFIPVTSTINTASNYQFTIIDGSLVSNSGTILISFPNSKFSLSGISCFSTSNSAVTYTCSAVNTSIIQLTYTASGSNLLQLTVSSIRNPSSVASITTTYSFTSTGANSSASFSYSEYTAASFISCGIVMSPNTVNEIGTAQFSMTLRNTVPIGGSIKIEFPSIWPDTAGTATPIPSTSTRAYTFISGTSLPTSFTNITTTIAIQTINLPSIFTTVATNNSVISFGISGILAPPTGSSSNTVTITTLNANSQEIDKSSSCAVSSPSAQTITMTSVSALILGTSSSITMDWTSGSPLRNSDTITVTLPGNMDFVNLTSVLVMRYGSSGLATLQVSSGASSQQKIFTINLTPTTTIIASASTLTFTISSITTLINSAARSIAITVKRASNSIATGTLSVTTTPNTFTNTSISSTTKSVQQTTSLTISFTTINNLQSSSIIQIIIPSQIITYGTTPACTVSSSNSLSSISTVAPNCTLNNRTLVIQGYLSGVLGGGSILSVTLPNVTNPSTTIPTSPFIIYTYYSSILNTDVVDQSLSLTYTASSVEIGNVTVGCASTVVGQYSVCSIAYQVKSILYSNSLITVEYPSQMTLLSGASFRYSVDGGTSQSINPSINSQLLNFSSILNTTLNAGSTITITITTLRNPLSMKPSSTFKIYSYTGSYLYLQQSITNGLTITTASRNTFTSLVSDAPNYINYNPTLYTFNIKLSIQLSVNDQLTIALGAGTNQMEFTSDVKCYINSVSVSCTNINRQLTFVMTLSLSTSTVHSILIESITLGRSFAVSPPITVSTYTSDGYGVSTQTISSLANTRTQSLDSMSLTIIQSPSQLNQNQSFTLSFVLNIPLISTDYILLSIPTIYTYRPSSLQNSSLCSAFTTTCLHHNSNQNVLKVTSSFFNTVSFSLNIKDNLYSSPISFSYNKQDYFTITTYDASDNIMEVTDTTITKVTFVPTCTPNCKTCLTTALSTCQSCYTAGDGDIANVTFDGPYFITSDFQCVTSCSAGYYSLGTSCIACISPCATCSNDVDCLSCASNFSYYSTTKRCLNPCLSGTYATVFPNSFCQACQSPCLTCVTAASTCLSCNGTLLLSNSECVSVCPSGAYESAGSCLSCHVSCAACSLSSTNCSSCSSGYYANSFVSGYAQCSNVCPAGTVNSTNNNVWSCTCAPQCKTCSVLITQCDSCDTSNTSVYPWKTSNGLSCVSSCSAGTYAHVTLQQCIQCPQSNCKLCNQTACTECYNTTYLSQGACVSSCPTGTILISTQCKSCPTGCSVCSTLTSCSSCQSTFLKQEDTCLSACSSGFVNFNATVCLTTCPLNYVNISNKCQLDSNTTTNNTTTNGTTSTTTVSQSRIIPFPFIIGYIVTLGIAIASKIGYEWTIVSCVLVSIGGLLEVGSWITLLLIQIVNYQQLTNSCLILLGALGINMLLNILSFIFMKKYVEKDENYTRSNVKVKCLSNATQIVSLIMSHKLLNLLFSNMFRIRAFSHKLSTSTILTPINIVLYFSIIPSLTAIIAGGISSYSLQIYSATSSNFIQSIDVIVVTILNCIVAIWVTVRNDQQYVTEHDGKFYDTQQQINNGNSDAVDEMFIAEGEGDRRQSKVNNRAPTDTSFFKMGQPIMNEHDLPLNQRTKRNQPIRMDKDQKSSEALIFNKEKNGNRSSDSDIKVEDYQGDRNIFQPKQKHSSIRIKPKQGSQRNQRNQKNQKNDQLIISHPIVDQNSQSFKRLPKSQQDKIREANKIAILKNNALNERNRSPNNGSHRSPNDTRNRSPNNTRNRSPYDTRNRSPNDTRNRSPGSNKQPNNARSLQRDNDIAGQSKVDKKSPKKLSNISSDIKSNLSAHEGYKDEDVEQIILSPKKSESRIGRKNKNSKSPKDQRYKSPTQDNNNQSKQSKNNDSRKEKSVEKNQDGKEGKSKRDKSLKNEGKEGNEGKGKEEGKVRDEKGKDDEKEFKKQMSEDELHNAQKMQEEIRDSEDEKVNKKLQRMASEGLKKNKKYRVNKLNDYKTPTNKANQSKPQKDTDLYILFDGKDEKPKYQRSQQIFEDEPELPVFNPQRKNNQFGTQIDKLDVIHESQMEEIEREGRAKNKNLTDKSYDLQRGFKKNKNTPVQSNTRKSKQKYNIPQMRSTENLNEGLKNQQLFRKTKNLQNRPNTIKMNDIFIQSEDIQSIDSQSGHLFEEISPSSFNFQNQRFHQTDDTSEPPQKPIYNYQIDKEDAQEISQEDEFDDELNMPKPNPQYHYDSILTKKTKNQRVTDLEKIYLPRLEVRKRQNNRK